MHRYGTPKAPSSVAGSTAGSSAAAMRRDVIEAAQFKCHVGGEWKPRACFSKKNLNMMENKFKYGMKFTAANTGMKCRDHSGEPKLERRCEGPCNQVKVLGDFSKSSLTSKKNWCQHCIQWQLLQDDHQDDRQYAPLDALEEGTDAPTAFSRPTGDDASDRPTVDVATDRPIGDDASDGESVPESMRSNMFSAFLLRPTGSDSASGQLLPTRASGSIPPHLKSFATGSNGGMPPDDDAEDDYYPDDASICPDDSASQFGGHAGPRLTAAALQQKEQSANREQPPAYFNSWDTSGRQHMQRRTGESDVESQQSFGTRVLSTVAASSVDRRSHGTAPSSWKAESVSAHTKKWGKAPRMAQPPPPIPEWNEDDIHYSDNGSEPDLP